MILWFFNEKQTHFLLKLMRLGWITLIYPTIYLVRGAGYSTRPGRLNYGEIAYMPTPKRCDGVHTPSRFGIGQDIQISLIEPGHR